jgi:hypothetical protein
VVSLDKDTLKKIGELRGLAEHARALALSLADAEAREKVVRSAAELDRQAAVLESNGAASLPAGALPEANAANIAEAMIALAATDSGGEDDTSL